MEHLVIPTFVLDTQCRVLIWNKACERLTGITASQVLGTSDHWRAFYAQSRPCLADLIVQERIGEASKFYAEPVRGERGQYGLHAENWCLMPHVGSRFYLAIDAGPIYDDNGRLLAVVETLRDMTAQKEAESALRLLANSDALTALANRRHFDEVLQTEWLCATRQLLSLSLLMIDIDNFKCYNDSYGHQAGDQCLKAVAAAIASYMLHPGDIACRYGGDEFAAVLPATSLAGACIVAEHIRESVEQLNLSYVETQASFRITISIGVASCGPHDGADPQAFIRSADAALYEAKRSGRNRVISLDLDGSREAPSLAEGADPAQRRTGL
jgi:diguanylate cyclase (GGDEF)-like protein/PAS domain S-box-containing protein